MLTKKEQGILLIKISELKDKIMILLTYIIYV